MKFLLSRKIVIPTAKNLSSDCIIIILRENNIVETTQHFQFLTVNHNNNKHDSLTPTLPNFRTFLTIVQLPEPNNSILLSCVG